MYQFLISTISLTSSSSSLFNFMNRKGSVIIQHEVFYNYNDMNPDERQLSAGDIYERTLAPSVDSKHTFGNSTFTECTDCTDTHGTYSKQYSILKKNVNDTFQILCHKPHSFNPPDILVVIVGLPLSQGKTTIPSIGITI